MNERFLDLANMQKTKGSEALKINVKAATQEEPAQETGPASTATYILLQMHIPSEVHLIGTAWATQPYFSYQGFCMLCITCTQSFQLLSHKHSQKGNKGRG